MFKMYERNKKYVSCKICVYISRDKMIPLLVPFSNLPSVSSIQVSIEVAIVEKEIVETGFARARLEIFLITRIVHGPQEFDLPREKKARRRRGITGSGRGCE